MEIKCAGCDKQLNSSRKDFQDVFYYCRLNDETDVSDNISDSVKNSTNKVADVVKTGKCIDFQDKKPVETEVLVAESEKWPK